MEIYQIYEMNYQNSKYSYMFHLKMIIFCFISAHEIIRFEYYSHKLWNRGNC